MNLEGRLFIELAPGVPVRIESRRPVAVTRLFLGKTPDQLQQLIPLLLPLCGTAHSHCALQACRQALGATAAPEIRAAQCRLADVETLREHGLRMLLDWARFLGEPAAAEPLRILAGSLTRCRSAWFGGDPAFPLDGPVVVEPDAADDPLPALTDVLSRSLFGARPDQWRATISGWRELQAWAEQGETVAARLLRFVFDRGWQPAGGDDLPHLPPLGDAELAERLARPDAGDFCRAPCWQGQPRETTCLSRQQQQPLIADLLLRYGKGLLTRLTARIVEAATLAAGLNHGGTQLSDPSPAPNSQGFCIGQAEAARGRLVHGLVLEQGRVARYHVVAPTEWNFHPRGPAARALAALAPGSDRRRQAELLIQAIDPCVGFDLRVEG